MYIHVQYYMYRYMYTLHECYNYPSMACAKYLGKQVLEHQPHTVPHPGRLGRCSSTYSLHKQ